MTVKKHLVLTRKIKTIQRMILNKKKKPLEDKIKIFINPAYSLNFFKNLHLGIQKELNEKRQDLTGLLACFELNLPNMKDAKTKGLFTSTTKTS